MRVFKDYVSLLSGFVLQIIAMWLEWIDNVELLRLQKIFYMFSIVLIWIGITQVTFQAKMKRRKRIIDAITDTQQAKKIVELAKDPHRNGEKLVSTFHLIQKGGKKMKAKLAALTWLQIVSLIATAVLFGLGLAAPFVPELAPVAENFNKVAIGIGIVTIPGIFSRGTDLGTAIKSALPKKEQKEITQRIKDWQKKGEILAKQYAPILKLAADIKDLGGKLTQDQQIQYDTYIAQEKALKAKIEAEKKKLEVPINGQDL